MFDSTPVKPLTTTDSTEPSPEPGRKSLDLKAVTSLLNTCLVAIERSAWQLRGVLDYAHGGWKWLGSETESLLQTGRRLPARMQRLSRCGWMLTRILTSYRLWPTRSAFLSDAKREDTLNHLHRKNARLFVETSLTQGGAFLKVGQLLSSRRDILPTPWVEELSRLQDQALPETPATIQATLTASLGYSPAEVFANFDSTPLAAASIGQVHKAILKDGRTVAVKIQRPDIGSLIDSDMFLLKIFLNNIDSLLPDMDIATIFSEIERCLHEEMDYRREAASMKRVTQHLEKIDGVGCPQVIDELCNDNLLVTEFVEGRKLTDVLDECQRDQKPENISILMTRLLDAWLLQVLQLGFFHADPHPGNLLVTKDMQLMLLDFGACQELSETARLGYLRVLQASIIGDQKALASTLSALGFKTRSGKPDTLLAFTHALLTQLTERLSAQPEESPWLSEDELLAHGKELLAKLQEDPVDHLPPDFIMLARVFLSLGGLFVHYRPTMNLPALILKHLTWPQPAMAH